MGSHVLDLLLPLSCLAGLLSRDRMPSVDVRQAVHPFAPNFATVQDGRRYPGPRSLYGSFDIWETGIRHVDVDDRLGIALGQYSRVFAQPTNTRRTTKTVEEDGVMVELWNGE